MLAARCPRPVASGPLPVDRCQWTAGSQRQSVLKIAFLHHYQVHEFLRHVDLFLDLFAVDELLHIIQRERGREDFLLTRAR